MLKNSWNLWKFSVLKNTPCTVFFPSMFSNNFLQLKQDGSLLPVIHKVCLFAIDSLLWLYSDAEVTSYVAFATGRYFVLCMCMYNACLHTMYSVCVQCGSRTGPGTIFRFCFWGKPTINSHVTRWALIAINQMWQSMSSSVANCGPEPLSLCSQFHLSCSKIYIWCE